MSVCVKVENGNINKALIEFSKKMYFSGILNTYLEKQFFISKSEKRHKKNQEMKKKK